MKKIFSWIRSRLSILRPRFRLNQWRRGMRRWLRELWNSPRLLGDRYTPEDNTVVTLFTDQAKLFPTYQPRMPIQGVPRKRQVSVTLISTTRNEGDNARSAIESIFAQRRLPDEIIIVDSGSHDRTVETLQEMALRSPVPMKVIVDVGANISRGRNLAIAQASSPIIAAMDFGCRLEPGWLETLIAPFEIDPETDVAAGWYDAIGPKGQTVTRMGWATLANLTPQTYVPSSRSLAFTKAAWESVGGYPEWLTLTGEDTYFALELKRYTFRWAFVPDARVRWGAPPTPWAYWKKLYIWSIGDGEVGLDTRVYRWALLKSMQGLAALGVTLGLLLILILSPSPISVIIVVGWLFAAGGILYTKTRWAGYTWNDCWWEFPVHFVKVMGFLKGWSRRPVVDRRRYQSLHGLFYILSGIPIDDIGGGARCTQIALELLRRRWMVVFINKFPKYETVDLKLQIRHPNLMTAPLSNFSLGRFEKANQKLYVDKPKAALVEFPLKDFLPMIQDLKMMATCIVYDLLDEWNTSLGATWYTPQAEKDVIDAADSLVATAPSLGRRLESQSGRAVTLLPNAVNLRLFNHRRAYPRPSDLSNAECVITYIGSLWGEWFDWDLLLNVARSFPDSAVVAIGDYAGQCPNPPANLHFLGLKPQGVLPAYLAYTTVAIIPWKINAITQATSPLKVYEYLAMRKPVVAPAIHPLEGIPGVFLADSQDDFIALIAKSCQIDLSEDDVAGFLRENNWQTRVDALVKLAEIHRAQYVW